MSLQSNQAVPEIALNGLPSPPSPVSLYGRASAVPLVETAGILDDCEFTPDNKSRFQVQRVPSFRQEKRQRNPVELLALRRHSNVDNTFDPKRNTLTFCGATTYMYNTHRSVGSMGSGSDLNGQLSPHATYHSQNQFFSHGSHTGQLSPTGTNMYNKTFGRDTQEALPHMDHYRNLMSAISAMRQRPTLTELHEEQVEVPHSSSLIQIDAEDSKKGKRDKSSGGVKFGWIQGVLVRCLLNIFGVMLFLRLSWVTGQAGIGLASVIILLSAVVTVLTTMSMSAICTNGEVKGGGAYYMISRSLGPEFGGAIGIVFSLANAVAAAMYVVGFAETVVQLMSEYHVTITGNPLNDIRLIGCGTSVLLLGIVVIGMEWESKAQLGLLFILVVAIINFMIGTFIPPSQEKIEKGVSGYSVEVFRENFLPDFRGGETFFSIFSVFFPAATGILAGANISGDLKDPQKAIPKGTFLAILLTTIIYLVMVWMCGSVLLRDAAGPITATLVDHVNRTSFLNQSGDFFIDLTDLMETTNTANCSAAGPVQCPFGSINYNYSVGLVSAFRPLILAGIFAATLSSALASLVSAPKVFQAVGKDRLFPGTHFFAKEYGKSREPIRGYVLTFGIAIAVTCIAELNIIAPIISNFFLMAYTLINFSCFDASLAKSPGFRPAFKFYNKWLSLLGALLCLGVMFVINWWAALVTFVVVGGLYLYIRQAKPEVNWGSSTQAHAYQDALKTCQKLTNVEEHVKNFRPQILVLSGNPENRPDLVEFAWSITKRQSLLVCGHVFQGELSEHLKHLRSMACYNWFRAKKIRAFYSGVAANNLRQGAQVLLQTAGLGKLRPNTLMLGYKSDWQTDSKEQVDQYFNIIHDAFDLHYGVGVFRVPDGFDINKVTDDVLETEDSLGNDTYQSSDEEDEVPSSHGSTEAVSRPVFTTGNDVTVIIDGAENPTFNGASKMGKVSTLTSLQSVDEGISSEVSDNSKQNDSLRQNNVDPEESKVDSRFRGKQEGTIDVWWLFDDGGLTLLVPYILSTRASWKHCKLRVFCVGTKQGNINEDQRRIATLLNKFRIDFSHLTVIPDLGSKPKPESTEEFKTVIQDWVVGKDVSADKQPWMVSEDELLAHKPRTYRHLKLRELLLKHSKDAALIVMTLPVPKKATTPAGLYLSWLEVLTKDMPPILLLRGNQQNVLTFYS